MKNFKLEILLNYFVIIATLISLIIAIFPTNTLLQIYAGAAVVLGIILTYTFAFFEELKKKVRNNKMEILKIKENMRTTERIAELNARLNLLEKMDSK